MPNIISPWDDLFDYPDEVYAPPYDGGGGGGGGFRGREPSGYLPPSLYPIPGDPFNPPYPPIGTTYGAPPTPTGGIIPPTQEVAGAPTPGISPWQGAPTPQQPISTQEVYARATPGSPSFTQEWWDEFTQEHKGVTPDVFYSKWQNRKPGSRTWQDNLAFDTRLQAHFRAATGKSSLEPEDWERAYNWDRAGGRISGPGGQVFFQYDPMSPEFLPGAGPRRGYGTPKVVQPGETPPGQVAPAYQIEATPLPGQRTSFRIPEMAMGEISAAGRQAFTQGLRGQGWDPTGMQGAYGASEWGRQQPAQVWFPPDIWPGTPAGREAQYLTGELGWGGSRIPWPS